MSPRLKIPRKMVRPPAIKGFKPFGPGTDRLRTDAVILHYEEYESVRLCDYDYYTHQQAARIMSVSRPTFTRVYSSARQKIALAMVEGRPLSIEGGKVYFDSDWYVCSGCSSIFNSLPNEDEPQECPLCGSLYFSRYQTEEEKPDDKVLCVCIECGHRKNHIYGKPCSSEICQECGGRMRRLTRNESHKTKINKT